MAREQIKATLLQTGEGSSGGVYSRELKNAEQHHGHHIPQKSPQVPEESDGDTWSLAISNCLHVLTIILISLGPKLELWSH